MRPANRRPFVPSALLAVTALLVWACGSSGPTPAPSPSATSSAFASPSVAVTDDGQVVEAVTASPFDSPSESVISATPSSGESLGGTGVGSGGRGGVSGGGGPQLAPPVTPKPAPTFPRLPARTVTIAAAGDIACDPAFNKNAPQDCDQMATAALLGQLHPTAVLVLRPAW